MEAGRKVYVQPRVIAEVTESQMGQMHPRKIPAMQMAAKFFCGISSRQHLQKMFLQFSF
jgi:hypothetical protein